MDILMALQEKGRNLKVIMVPPSIYEQTSERVKSYLRENTKISLEKGKEPVGRPTKYSDQEVKKIIELRKRNISIVQISKELHIPRRTVYYLLNEGR